MSQLSIIQVRQTHFRDSIDYYYWPICHLLRRFSSHLFNLLCFAAQCNETPKPYKSVGSDKERNKVK